MEPRDLAAGAKRVLEQSAGIPIIRGEQRQIALRMQVGKQLVELYEPADDAPDEQWLHLASIIAISSVFSRTGAMNKAQARFFGRIIRAYRTRWDVPPGEGSEKA